MEYYILLSIDIDSMDFLTNSANWTVPLSTYTLVKFWRNSKVGPGELVPLEILRKH